MKTYLTIILVLAAMNNSFGQGLEIPFEKSGFHNFLNNERTMFKSFSDKSESHFQNINGSLFMPSDNQGDYGKGKSATFYSLAVPGLGLWMANKRIWSLGFAPICYGMVGGGIFLMIKGKNDATQSYSDYLIEKDPDLQDQYMDEADAGASKNTKGFYIMAGGAAIWLAQTAWTYIYGSFNDKYRKRDSNWTNPISSVSGGYDFKTNSATLNLTIKI